MAKLQCSISFSVPIFVTCGLQILSGIQALNRNLDLPQFRALHVTGNYSAILSSLDRKMPHISACEDVPALLAL